MLASMDYAKPLQDETEINELAQLLQTEGITSYLEIGARYGGSFDTIMRALPVGSFGMAIDLPGGPFGDLKSKPILLAAAERLLRDGYDIDVILNDCQSPLAYRRAYRSGPFGAVTIDADHSYEAVWNDFSRYAGCARIVVIHDIAAPEHVRSRDGRTVEVPRFWREIKRGHRHAEIVAPDSLMGFGILWMDQ